MNNFRAWYFRNDVKINWFLVGITTMSLASSIGQEDWIMVVLNTIILAALITADRLDSK